MQWPILARWVGEVLVPRYELTRDELPDCWALHPPVVAELSWLRTAYVQAYLPRSPPQLAADWHTRWRPAVLTRIRELINAPTSVAPASTLPRRGHAGRGGGAERGVAAHAAGRAAVLVAVLRPRLPPRPGGPPGPRRGGRPRLVPGRGERLSSIGHGAATGQRAVRRGVRHRAAVPDGGCRSEARARQVPVQVAGQGVSPWAPSVRPVAASTSASTSWPSSGRRVMYPAARRRRPASLVGDVRAATPDPLIGRRGSAATGSAGLRS